MMYKTLVLRMPRNFKLLLQAPQDAPPPRRQRRSRDHTDIGSGNVLPTAPGRQRRATDPFSPPVQRRRRR